MTLATISDGRIACSKYGITPSDRSAYDIQDYSSSSLTTGPDITTDYINHIGQLIRLRLHQCGEQHFMLCGIT